MRKRSLVRCVLAVASAVTLVCLWPAPVAAQAQVKIFGTNAAGQAIPIQVAADGTMKLTLAISGYEFLGTSFNTTLTLVDPTAARTITLPDATGTVALVTSPIFLTDLTIGAIATQDVLKWLPNTSATRFTGTLTPADLTADKTWTLPNTTGTVALTADKLSAFAATTSAELAGVISNETGSGALVFGTAPVLTTSVTVGAIATDSVIKLQSTTDATPFTYTIAAPDLSTDRALTLANGDTTLVAGTMAPATAPIFTTSGTFGLLATQDVITILPVTDNDRFTGTITPADLSADRTWTFPNVTGTVALIDAPSFTTSVAITGGGDTVTTTAAAGTVTAVATGSSAAISFVFTPKGVGQTTLTGGITGGCTGTPTVATAGVATTCTGPEFAPVALYTLIQQLQADVASLRAQLADRR